MAPRPKSARDSSLSVRVHERLRRAVMDAEFGLGEWLSEEKLSTALGVSRTPVREALNALQQEGLIDVQPQRGSFVFQATEADLEQLCQFRQVIEVQALRLCFVHNREVTASQMRAAIFDMDAATANGDLLASARADTGFHEALLNNCANDYFRASYRSVSGKIAALRVHQSSVDPRAVVNREHARIVDAFERGELTQAEAMLTEHILKMRDRYRLKSDPAGAPKRRHDAAAKLAPLV